MPALARPTVPDISDLIARCEADESLHIRSDGADDAELRCLEQKLGQALPGPLRAFLSRLGGGVYYLRHEIFGSRRVMIHDIELVPDILSFQRWLGPKASEGWLPFHRADGRIHAIRLGGPDPAPVCRLGDPSIVYPDFTAFLRSLMTSP
jgi:SMI1 / KNR4 family (SUKH-1)